MYKKYKNYRNFSVDFIKNKFLGYKNYISFPKTLMNLNQDIKDIKINNKPMKFIRKIIIDNSSNPNNFLNYQIRIILNNSNFNFSHTKSDGSDIRFLDSKKKSLLNYWIEKWDYTNQQAIIWVKIPFIPAFDSINIYLVYGNQDLNSDSNGDNVFEFFDDFNSPILDTRKWQAWASNISISNSIITTWGGNQNLFAKNITNGGIINSMQTYRIRFKAIGYGDYKRWGCGYYDQIIELPARTAYYEGSSTSWTSFLDVQYVALNNLPVYNWHIVEITYDGSIGKFYFNDNLKVQVNVTGKTLTQLFLNSCRRNAYDWVFIAKYTNLEPQIIIDEEIILKK